MNAIVGGVGLRGIRVLANASASTLQRVLETSTRRAALPGGRIAGTHRVPAAPEVLMVFAGVGRMSRTSPKGREVGFKWVMPGDLVGDSAAIDGGAPLAEVVAMNPMDYGVLPANVFLDVLRDDPAVAQAQLRELAISTRRYVDRAYELATFDARTRLYRELLRQAEPGAANTGVIRRRLRHEDWATMIGAQRHVVSQILKDLERRAIFRVDTDTATISNLDRLRSLVGEGESGTAAPSRPLTVRVLRRPSQNQPGFVNAG